jgi:hypothetical protein
VSPTSQSPAWPSSHDFVEAIQNPRFAFRDADLRECEPATDRFGLPIVASGNFAYAFKLRDLTNGRATGVRCFRGFISDRDRRYSLIDKYLDTNPNSNLTNFEFDPEGILVAGRRYPIVSMEWIEGPTLDLYVEQVLGNKAALQHLADAWLKVIERLHATKVAHGDLQHGNLIIHNSQFRLIDLDGMFVPAMQGWNSSEIGHQHYQHPFRDYRDFNLALDNFSTLVIYLSLLALAEAPELWHEFHDENLIFSKVDFVDPHSSKLFSLLKKMGQPQQHLAEALIAAAKAKPGDAPYLLDLAVRKSKLPTWMTAPSDVRVEVKTREASSQPTSSHTASQPSAYPPLWKPTAVVSVGKPQVPQSPLPQAVPPSQQQTYPRRALDWKRIHGLAWPKALQIGFFGLFFFWLWSPILHGVAEVFGIAKADSPSFVFWSYVLGCLVASYIFTVRREWSKASPSYTTVTTSQPRFPTPLPRSTTSAKGASGLKTAQQVVGSRVRFIYHRPTCEWAMKTSPRNRIAFPSTAAASSSGYRPCKVCRP